MFYREFAPKTKANKKPERSDSSQSESEPDVSVCLQWIIGCSSDKKKWTPASRQETIQSSTEWKSARTRQNNTFQAFTALTYTHCSTCHSVTAAAAAEDHRKQTADLMSTSCLSISWSKQTCLLFFCYNVSSHKHDEVLSRWSHQAAFTHL